MFWENFSDNLTKPMREETSIGDLVLWIVLIAIVAFALFDTLRILKSWISSS